MIRFIQKDIEGLVLIENFISRDDRGAFIKTFHSEKIKEVGFSDCFKESYYSISSKDVIRGMHFQTPPHDHEKLVYVTSGKILDVVVDLRKNSPSYGRYVAIEMEALSNSILIPKGCAHGFLTMSDSATVVYNVTTTYFPESDSGILWNSFGFDWPVCNPIISKRDLSFKDFPSFSSPFS